MLGHDAGQDVGRSARSERHDERDRTLRIGCGSRAPQRRGRGEAGDAGENGTSASVFMASLQEILGKVLMTLF